MADQIMTAGTELSVLVPEVWSRRYYDVLLASLPFSSIIDKSYEGEIQSLGNTVKVSTFPEFDTALDLAEGQAADAEAITVTQQSLVINKQPTKDFILTDRVLLQSLPAMDKLSSLANFSILKKINADIIATIVPSASTPDHQIAYDTGSTLVLADILEGKELLDTQNVPEGDRHMVLDTPQTNDIFNITALISADFIAAGNPVQSGNIVSPILGFTPHMTTTASAVTFLFHRSFMTMAAQKGLTAKQFDLGPQGKRAVRINLDTLWGLDQLDNTRVVTIS